MLPINQIPKEYGVLRSIVIGSAIAIGFAVGYNTLLSIKLNKKRLENLAADMEKKS